MRIKPHKHTPANVWIKTLFKPYWMIYIIPFLLFFLFLPFSFLLISKIVSNIINTTIITTTIITTSRSVVFTPHIHTHNISSYTHHTHGISSHPHTLITHIIHTLSTHPHTSHTSHTSHTHHTHIIHSSTHITHITHITHTSYTHYPLIHTHHATPSTSRVACAVRCCLRAACRPPDVRTASRRRQWVFSLTIAKKLKNGCWKESQKVWWWMNIWFLVIFS